MSCYPHPHDHREAVQDEPAAHSSRPAPNPIGGASDVSTLIIREVQLLNRDGSLSESVDILIDADTIAAIETFVTEPTSPVIEARGRIAIPGLVNAHTHAHNNLTKGMADNWTLEDLRIYGPALYANRSASDQYLSAAIGAIEMLKTGCTAAYDQFVAVPIQTVEGIDAVMQAYVDVGIRAVIAPGFTDMSMYDAIPGLNELLPDDLRQLTKVVTLSPTRYMLQLAEGAIQRWDGKLEGRIKVGTAPLIVGECTDELLSGCSRLSSSYGVSLHTHMAESKVQAISSFQRFGTSIVDRLGRLGVLGPNLIAAHSIWIDHDDILHLADAGAKIAHNPASNLKLGSGIAPIRELLEAGATVGLGTDGSMASDNQNMFEAMRFAALVGKVRFAYDQDRWLSAHEVFDMATQSGAKILGLEDQIGSIEVGKKADIVLLNAKSNYLRPRNNIMNSLVYAETGVDVDKVLVGGRLVVDGGKVLTVNEEDIYEQAQVAVERLMKQNKKLFALARRLEPFVKAACTECAKSPLSVACHTN